MYHDLGVRRRDPNTAGGPSGRGEAARRRTRPPYDGDRPEPVLEWRFNNRDNPYIFRDTLSRIMNTDPLEYRRLIA